jgi:AcrR family transcriptional regulator
MDNTIDPATQERIERAHAILDAAKTLILRWGYNKTTVDDIAKEAEVGKGTIYLHWKTRDDLFLTLIRRERLALSDDLQARIDADPDGARLGNILKHTMIATLNRPLLKALVLQRREVWGKLLEREQDTEAYIQKMAGFKAYLEFVQSHKLVRHDDEPQAQVVMVSSIVTGFFQTSELLPPDYQSSDEELANLLCETVRRTFEPQEGITTEQLQIAKRSFLEYVSKIATLMHEQFNQDMAT